jgi:hypothetical protein
MRTRDWAALERAVKRRWAASPGEAKTYTLAWEAENRPVPWVRCEAGHTAPAREYRGKHRCMVCGQYGTPIGWKGDHDA